MHPCCLYRSAACSMPSRTKMTWPEVDFAGASNVLGSPTWNVLGSPTWHVIAGCPESSVDWSVLDTLMLSSSRSSASTCIEQHIYLA